MNQSPIQNTGAGTGSMMKYTVGFVLAVMLTTVSFALVMNGAAVARGTVLAAILGAAVAQILVHLHFFLHLDRSSAARWNILALIFTALIMILFVGGTIWIMFDLNARMM